MEIRYVTSTGGDLNGFAADLRQSSGRVGAAAASALRAGAARIERAAKTNAAVDTGAMRNSIGTTQYGDGRHGVITVEIGPTVHYAPYVELGTSRMRPRPFLGPAVDQHEHGILAAIAQAVGDAL